MLSSARSLCARLCPPSLGLLRSALPKLRLARLCSASPALLAHASLGQARLSWALPALHHSAAPLTPRQAALCLPGCAAPQLCAALPGIAWPGSACRALLCLAELDRARNICAWLGLLNFASLGSGASTVACSASPASLGPAMLRSASASHCLLSLGMLDLIMAQQRSAPPATLR